MIGIVSTASKLFKTVGLLAVRLHLAKLRSKNRKKYVFLTKIECPLLGPKIISVLAGILQMKVRLKNFVHR